MFLKRQPLHFTGIGGIGMSGIAEVLLNLGYDVSGSDLKLSPITERLARLGARIHEGHAASNVGEARVLVVSSAVTEDNPEVIEARRRQIPVIPRGEMLAELMRLRFGVAVAGSHGKTTTTSMIATVLCQAGLDPTVVVGGRAALMGGSNARVGRSEFLVVESDESDRSFLKLAPILAVVTNIDREHVDCYASIEETREAFLEFVNKVPFYGAAILCVDDENVRRILPRVGRRTITYGTAADAGLRIERLSMQPGGSRFDLRAGSRMLGTFQLPALGLHNVLNAAAAVAVCLELDVAVERIRQALASFVGVERRFQVRGREREITVADDYGHHPTEVKATLAAARLGGFRRIHVVFQPHRYTRTAQLADEFAGAFGEADTVAVLDIYAASEKPIPGVTAEALAEKIRLAGQRGVRYAGCVDRAVDFALEAAGADDLILTLGAGNVWQAADRILERLRGESRGGEEAGG